jgi:group II intron reverse transcriptase/maturase
VKANRGSSGIDDVTIETIEHQGIEDFLLKLHLDLKEGRYKPSPVRRVYIPKPDGSKRPLGIPTIRDRVIQQACRIILEPIFEADFSDASFGFRPKKSAQEASERVRSSLVCNWRVVDADIQGFFDTLNHELLMRFVSARVSDRRVLKLLRQWLKAGVLEKGSFSPTLEGTPQGGVISPLLANIYLDKFDKAWKKYGSQWGALIRYADDFVVICRYKHQAEKSLQVVKRILEALKLQVHPRKTRLVDLNNEGFDFLGFYIRKIHNVRTGKQPPVKWPSQKAMKAIQSKIKEHTQRRWTSASLSQTVAVLNPLIRGWRNYFQTGNSTRAFQAMDNYVRYRLWKLFKAKHGPRCRRGGLKFERWIKGCGIEKCFRLGQCGRTSIKPWEETSKKAV